MEDKKYNVYLWPGCGYVLDTFETEAFCEEEALDKVVAEIVNANDKRYFLDEDEYAELFAEELAEDEEFESDQYIYYDATMSGANRPVYLLIENARIERVKEAA